MCAKAARRVPGNSPRRVERLGEIGQDVVDMLQPDRQPDIAGVTPVAACSTASAANGGAGRMDRQAAGVADIGDVVEQLQRVDELRPASRRRRVRSRAGRPAAAAGISPSAPPPTPLWCDGWMTRVTSLRPGQEVGDGQRVRAVLAHAQRQRLDALQEQEGVERRHAPRRGRAAA